ncbi:MAG: right-handed parallel beta-helix repeat-containing protein [Chitinophagales bacterium]
MRSLLQKIFCVIIIAISFSKIAQAQTILRVNAGNSNSSKTADGSSWSSAFPDLQSALKAAAVDISQGQKVQVWVAQGTYYPSAMDNSDDRETTFNIPSGVSLYGGFHSGDEETSKRSTDASTTILSGDIGKKGDNHDNCFSVLTILDLSSATVVDGFTITGGNAEGSSRGEGDGGGIFNRNGENNLTIANCIFTKNEAVQGSAVYNSDVNDNCSPKFDHCKFIDNSAAAGTVYNFAGQNFTECRPVFLNCLFASNSNVEQGVAVNHCLGNNTCNPAFINCIFYMNTLSTKNGDESQGSAVSNQNSGGMGDVSPVFVNCTMTANEAAGNAATIYNSFASPTFINCIVWGNKGGGISPGDANHKPSVSYSDVQGWKENSNATNMDADPIFIDVNHAAGKDGIWGTDDDGLIPNCNSPVRGKADASAIMVGARVPTTDFSDNTRSNDDMDMGAYAALGIVNPLLQIDSDKTSITFCKGDQITIKATTNVPGSVYTWYRTKHDAKPVADATQHGDIYTANDFDDAETIYCTLAIDPSTCSSAKTVNSGTISMEEKICATTVTAKTNYLGLILFSVPLLILVLIMIRDSFFVATKKEEASS